MKLSKGLIIQLGFAAFVVALVLWRGPSEESVSVALNIILVVAVAAFLRVRFPERYQKDERTNKITSYALSWSWILAYLLVAVLILVDYFRLAELSASLVLSGVFFVMTATMLAFRWFFGRKGDAP